MGFASLGWAALAIAVPFILAALVDPEARPLVLRRLRGWLALLFSLANSLFRLRRGSVSGQVDEASGRNIPLQQRNVEGAEDNSRAVQHLMPPSANSRLFTIDTSVPPPPLPSAPVFTLKILLFANSFINISNFSFFKEYEPTFKKIVF